MPVPVPSDLLILGAGIQAALGRYTLLELALTLEVAVFIGCSVQFLLVRGAPEAHMQPVRPGRLSRNPNDRRPFRDHRDQARPAGPLPRLQ